MSTSDPILGCILGGAIGDVSGEPYENRWTPPDISDDYPWQISDDTQLTLATCEAITVIVLRAHYTMDVFAGAVTALLVAMFVSRLAELCDRVIARI